MFLMLIKFLQEREYTFLGRGVYMKHLTLKELPVSERPYEKCEQYGTKALSDAELLAVILKTGVKGERSIELAERVLAFSEERTGLYGLHYHTMEELMTIRGIGRVKAIQLVCLAELTKRMAKQQNGQRPLLTAPDVIANYYMQDLRCLEQEQAVLLLLDTKCHKIKDFVISKGTVNASIVDPRDIFIKALQYKAVNIVLIHNHPSGDVTPSKADIHLTERIPLLDHVIIGDNSYLSFREQGLL